MHRKEVFLPLFQDKTMDNTTHLEKFNDLTNAIESCGGSIGNADSLTKLYPKFDTLDPDERKVAKKDVIQRHLAHSFLKGSDGVPCSKLKEDLENSSRK